MYEDKKAILEQLLTEQSNAQRKAWWENYVKQSAPYLGVKMADIRSAVHQWYRAYVSDTLALEQQVDLALALFAGSYTEEKLAGTLLLQEILLPANALQCEHDLDRLARLFSAGYIYDWNVCDWFCVKLLGDLIRREGVACAGKIAAWQSAENLWQARASLVAFVPVARDSQYYALIDGAGRTVIKRPERFAKTAVGWILRDISKYDEAFVHAFVHENINDFSPESLKNATKYFHPEERTAYLEMLKRDPGKT